MLEIESWEDRSGQATPDSNSFGYVYFNDDSRVGFSPNTPDTPPVWPARTNGGGRRVPVTGKHITMATKLLVELGILDGK